MCAPSDGVPGSTPTPKLTNACVLTTGDTALMLGAAAQRLRGQHSLNCRSKCAVPCPLVRSAPRARQVQAALPGQTQRKTGAPVSALPVFDASMKSRPVSHRGRRAGKARGRVPAGRSQNRAPPGRAPWWTSRRSTCRCAVRQAWATVPGPIVPGGSSCSSVSTVPANNSRWGGRRWMV
jgi:hypothetical protein